MEDEERCFICNNEITKYMDICPNCGTIIQKLGRYNHNVGKNLEYLEKIDETLVQLEEELDIILCKKQ